VSGHLGRRGVRRRGQVAVRFLDDGVHERADPFNLDAYGVADVQ
jgi:hypothetical protein